MKAVFNCVLLKPASCFRVSLPLLSSKLVLFCRSLTSPGLGLPKSNPSRLLRPQDADELHRVCQASDIPLLDFDQEEGDILFVGMGAAHLVSNLASNIKASLAGREGRGLCCL